MPSLLGLKKKLATPHKMVLSPPDRASRFFESREAGLGKGISIVESTNEWRDRRALEELWEQRLLLRALPSVGRWSRVTSHNWPWLLSDGFSTLSALGHWSSCEKSSISGLGHEAPAVLG